MSKKTRFVQSISQAELINIFKGGVVNGNTFVGIDTETIPYLKGGRNNPMKDKVVKITRNSNVMVFQNRNINGYRAMVRRRLESEGKNTEFTLKPRIWGVRVENTPLVEHKGKYYLEIIYLTSGDVHYEHNGVNIDKSLVTGLDLNKIEGKQGGLDDKVIIRTPAISSIKRITINKETYVING